MLQKLKQVLSKLDRPLTFLKTKQNVVIIQLFPKKNVLSVSYKGEVRTAQFNDTSLRRMMKGGKHFEDDTFNVFGAVVHLIADIIKQPLNVPNTQEKEDTAS